MAKTRKYTKGFFTIDSIPNVMFLYGKTTYVDCKKIDNNLKEKDYDEAINIYKDKFEKKPVKTVIKTDKKDFKDK